MKRFLLFSSDLYYPCGGFDDFINDFDDLDDAKRQAQKCKKEWNWCHVVDGKIKEIVYRAEGDGEE